MGAEYLSYVKFIASEAPTFFGYILSVLASMSWLQEESIPLWRHIYLSVTFLTLSSWIGHAEVIFTEKVTNNFRSRICNIIPQRFHDFFQTFQRMTIA